MGSEDGWFGKSALIYFCVLRECVIAQWDFMIFECTQHLDHRGLEPLLTWYTSVAFCFSPTLLGFPCTRVRKYMLLIRSTRYKFIDEATEFGHYELFEVIFGRRVVMKGVDLCRATPEDLQNHKNVLATAENAACSCKRLAMELVPRIVGVNTTHGQGSREDRRPHGQPLPL